MKLSLCLVVLSAAICNGWPQPKSSAEWFSEGISLANTGNYGSAVRTFREALSAACGSGASSQDVVKIMDSLAGTYTDAGSYLEAEHEWRKALAMVGSTEGPDSLDFALITGSVETLPTVTKTSEESISVVRRAIARYSQVAPLQGLAKLRGDLVQMLVRQKEYAEAEKVLADWQSTPASKSDRRQSVHLLNAVGTAQYEQGRFADSVQSFQDVLAVIEDQFGIAHPLLVSPLNNLAGSLLKMGRTDEAVNTYQRANGICMKTMEPDHPACGIVLQNYSIALRRQGRKQEAKALAKQARRVEEASSRRNGLGTVVSLTSLRPAGQ